LIYSSLSADFSFGSYKDDQNQLPSAVEARLDYELAAQIGTSAAWEVFLRKHPSGFYAELAKEQIAKINAPAPRPPMAATPDQQVVDAPPKPNLPFIQPQPDPEVKPLSDRIKSSPQDANAFYKRGIYYAKSGDFARAIKDFDEVIRLQPRDPEAFNNRCFARAMIADLQRALDDCTHALELRPGYADALDSRGFVNLKFGKPAEAIIDYDAALKLSSGASSLYGRGLAKKRIGAAGGDKDIIATRALDPEIVNQFATDNIGQQFPEFPWPPPKSSALYVIPRDMFVDEAGGAPLPGFAFKSIISQLPRFAERLRRVTRQFFNSLSLRTSDTFWSPKTTSSCSLGAVLSMRHFGGDSLMRGRLPPSAETRRTAHRAMSGMMDSINTRDRCNIPRQLRV
jgi:tetratricopeptide (TPR) repeat protein